MKITCSLQQPQIEKLYAHLYGHLLDNQKKSKVFDAEAYMKNLFDKIASKTDPNNAAKFLQQIPSLLGCFVRLSTRVHARDHRCQ